MTSTAQWKGLSHGKGSDFFAKNLHFGISLVVQQLRLQVPNAGDGSPESKFNTHGVSPQGRSLVLLKFFVFFFTLGVMFLILGAVKKIHLHMSFLLVMFCELSNTLS